MNIGDDSFSLIWQEIEQGMKMQYLPSLKCDPTSVQENISANSNLDPMKEVYRTGLSNRSISKYCRAPYSAQDTRSICWRSAHPELYKSLR